MTENDVRAIALFFFYALLDDQKAIEAGARALNLAKDIKRKNTNISTSLALITATDQVWKKEEAEARRQFAIRSLNKGWALPDGTDLSPWRDFHKQSTGDEISVVIWSKILGLPESEIALALELPEGTIRYRVNHALRKLGDLTSSRPSLV